MLVDWFVYLFVCLFVGLVVCGSGKSSFCYIFIKNAYSTTTTTTTDKQNRIEEKYKRLKIKFK